MKGAASSSSAPGCTSCHHNMLQAVAFSMARKRGIVVDDEKVRHNYQQSVAWVKGSQEGLFEDIPFPVVKIQTPRTCYGSLKPIDILETVRPMLSSTN